MRLWHKDLIKVLPNAQLRGQWNEINAIVGAINVYGYPRHGLVNFIMDYDSKQFKEFCDFVLDEINERNKAKTLNYHPKASVDKVDAFFSDKHWDGDNPKILFEKHHNDEYLKICYYNLLEKYRAALMSEAEWQKIVETVNIS